MLVSEHWYYVIPGRFKPRRNCQELFKCNIHNVCIILHMWTSFYSFNIVTKLFISGVYVFYDVSRGEMLMISYIRRLFDISHRGLFLMICVIWNTFYDSRNHFIRKFGYHTSFFSFKILISYSLTLIFRTFFIWYIAIKIDCAQIYPSLDT